MVGTEGKERIANKLEISIRTLERTKKKYHQYKKLTRYRKYLENSDFYKKEAEKAWIAFEFANELNNIEAREEFDTISFIEEIQRYFEICPYGYDK